MSLTTHVLDTSRGVPAAGVRLELLRLQGAIRTEVTSDRTNADGRTDMPLVLELEAGEYELVFAVGDYFAAHDERSFYDRVPVRFVVRDPDAHHHVPLLVAPWAYSTYRGS